MFETEDGGISCRVKVVEAYGDEESLNPDLLETQESF